MLYRHYSHSTCQTEFIHPLNFAPLLLFNDIQNLKDILQKNMLNKLLDYFAVFPF